MATNNQIAALRKASWENGQQSADQRALAFSQTIRGVENYRDASGRSTELAGGYSNAWKLNDGSYLMSINPNFDVRRDLGLDALKLEPDRR